MNYFAHGIAFIGQPEFLAGTAVPDWLNVANRKIRLRPHDLWPYLDGTASPTARFAAGILKHLEDDEWFHNTAGFARTTQKITRSFRNHLAGERENPRAPFLGHITTELLLDAVLIAKQPERLNRYYASLAAVNPGWIEETVSRFTGRAVSGLSRFVERFLEARFLFDYLESPKLLYRLNQVVSRIKLRPLPESTTEVIVGGRLIVERHLPDLLPAGAFPFPQFFEDDLP